MEWKIKDIPPLEEFQHDARWYSRSGHLYLVTRGMFLPMPGISNGRVSSSLSYLLRVPFQRKIEFLKKDRYDRANVEKVMNNAKPFQPSDIPIYYLGSKIDWRPDKFKQIGSDIWLEFVPPFKRLQNKLSVTHELIVVIEAVLQPDRIFFKEAKYHFTEFTRNFQGP